MKNNIVASNSLVEFLFENTESLKRCKPERTKEVEDYEKILCEVANSLVDAEIAKPHADIHVVRYPKIDISNIVCGDVDGDVALESVFR